MHELPVTETILEVVLAHAARHDASRIVTIYLQVGKLSDLEDEWMQHYFDHLSQGTLAEGARLAIERTPIRLACDSCGASYTVETADQLDQPCPQCGQQETSLIGGREYFITNMEVV